MARIFRKLYHELSSSWDFRQTVRDIDTNSVQYNTILDQDGYYHLTFYITGDEQDCSAMTFMYKISTDEAIFSEVINKKFFYKYVDFAYNYITSNKLAQITLTTFQRKICKDNEYVQTQYLNIGFQIEGMYGNSEFGIRNAELKHPMLKVYFKGFEGDIFSNLINSLTSEQPLSHSTSALPLGRGRGGFPHSDLLSFFSSDELSFFEALYKQKKSVGLKNKYIGITSEAFVRLIPFIKNLQDRFTIYETGDKLVFADKPLSLNFICSQVDPYNFILKLSDAHIFHHYFVFLGVYVLNNNVIHKVHLPFPDEVIKAIFEGQLTFKRTDLVYYKTIVGRQLSLFNHYLDFEEGIDFPEVNTDMPEVYFLIESEERGELGEVLSVESGKLSDRSLLRNGELKTLNSKLNSTLHPPPSTLKLYAYLEYSDDQKIPLTVAYLRQNLFKLDFVDPHKWYYLPDDLLENIRKFLLEELFYTFTKEDIYDWEVSRPVEIEYIKANLYEKANPNWHLVISDELKSEFVQTIHLMPHIELVSDGDIDWFSYKVTYKYHDTLLTQDTLRDFFNSGAAYFTAPDGSNITIANRKVFYDIEDMIHNSHKGTDHFYKIALYRLPWMYQLAKLNPAITIYGDPYLDAMYTDIKKRALPNAIHPHYTLNLVMRSYQKAGYEWLKMLEKYRLNGILADDMGLGKTLQAISVLTDRPPDSKSLILCPKTLLFNWAAEIDKFNPNLKYLVYEGNKDYRTNLLKTVPVQIVICSYNLVQNDLSDFSEINWDYIILDEAQHIKNHTTLRAKAIKKLKSRHKLAMTGTPLENNISELWSIFDFLMAGYLPPLKRFSAFGDRCSERDDSENTIDSRPPTSENRINQYIAPFILRRKKQDVLIELPDKQEQAIYCNMTEKQERHYISVLNAIQDELFSSSEYRTPNTEHRFNYITMLTALTRLRQICDHPGLINDSWLTESDLSGKLDTLSELLSEALQSGRKILIFSQYIKMLKLIENLVKKHNILYEYMDGATKDRQSCISHFNNNEKVRVFLISLKTGGFGINLTAADTVILVDPWWNPMIENQAIDRVHRMGQTKKVLIYKLITKGSVEEKIMLLQKRKRDLFENIIEQGEAVLKSLDLNEIKQLFEYKE